MRVCQRDRHHHAPTTLIVTFVITLLVPALPAFSQLFGEESCTIRPQHLRIESDADVTIGAVLPIHGSGEGVYGCGPASEDGVQVFEAMRWAVDVLNRKSGLISTDSRNGQGSLIPGVKMGLKVYDSCGHSALAVEHLTSLFPILRSGPKSCDFQANNSSLTIGVVDMSQSISRPEVSESLRDYFIPSIQLSLSTLVPPEKMAQVLLSAAKELKWSHVTVLHEDEEYSISVTKLLTQSAATGGSTCITGIHSLPRISGSMKSNRKELRPFRKTFKAATNGLVDGAAFIVISRSGETTERFLQVMSEFPELLQKIQWLFSWIPPVSSISTMNEVLAKNVRIYSIAPYPDKVVQFEDYWSALARTAHAANPDDRWFLEYFMAEKGCKVPGPVDPMYKSLPNCSDRQLNSNPIETLLRTSRAVPALTSIFTLATAFHKAWEYKCNGTQGICTELRSMMRKEFVSQFLEPIEYVVHEDADMHTRTRAPRATERLEGNKFALTLYGIDEQKNIGFRQVVVFEGLGSRLLDPNFKSLPSTCSGAGCRGCVRPRQSRIDDPIQRIDTDIYEEDYEDLENEADIVVPLLLPLHRQGLSMVECGSELNPEAVQSLEAALWIVDRINEDRGFLSGATLGLSVVDTCSSPLLATQRLTTFVTEHGGSLSNLAVISAASAEETLAASRVLRPLNISVLSVSDLTAHLSKDDHLGFDHHLLQIENSVDSVFEAALDLFDDAGWKFITVVHSNGPAYLSMKEKLAKIAKQHGTCIGAQIEVHSEDQIMMRKVVQRVMDAKLQGSNVVVFLTDAESTKGLLSEFGRFYEASALQSGDLLMVGLGEWARDTNLVRGLEKVALGSLVFKEEHGIVAEFSTYFRKLHPESNFRNPWISLMLQQENTEHRNLSDNPLEKAILYQSTTTTIQAVVALAAGVAAVRNELCQLDMGLCPAMLQNDYLQQMVGEHILSSLSPRLDHPGQTFKFSKDGHGSTPIAIFNMRKMNDQSMKYMKVASYSGHLIKLANMLTYNQNGEVALYTLPSQCISDCYRCQYSSASHALIPSSKDLYIAVTLGIHEPTANPLVCGALRPTGGLQNFEALLWAIDTINGDLSILPGIDLGLVVFDTCGSREKTAMDVSNFLTGKKDNLPSPHEIVAFLAEGTQDEVKPIVDVTMSLGMTTVAPSVVSPEFSNIKKYSHLLKMSEPSSVVISSMVDILRYFHWKYVSVVYTDGITDYLTGNKAFEEFKRQTEAQGIEIAVAEKIGQTEEIPTTMDIIAHRLKIKQNIGARVVVLLLSPDHVGHLMSAVKRLQHVGRSRVGDFVWVAHDSLEPFQMFPDQTASAIVLKSRSGDIPAFGDYFTSLDIKNNTRNPWFREYWEQVFNCRGSSCSSATHETLKEFGFVQDPSVSKTVNSLFTIVLGLDSLQRQLCPGGRGFCSAMKNQLLVREKLFDYARKLRFTGLDGTPVMFDENNYVKGKLDVYNFRDIGDVRAFLNVGTYDEMTGLSINSSMTRGYDDQGKQIPLPEIHSICNDSDACVRRRSDTGAPLLPFMKIPANQEFVIGVMMPVHQPGNSFFTCSRVVEESSLQNLFALSYALEKVNQNSTILPEIQLGALVFDHCGRRQKAEEQIFSFIASDGSLPYSEANLRSRAMVAALTYDPQVADDLSPLFESVLIPQIATPTGLVPLVPSRQRRSSSSMDEIPVNTEIIAVADTLKKFDWKYVTLLHGGSETDRSLFWNFVETAKERKICIAKSLVIKPDMPVSELSALFSEELDPSADSKVIVLLLDDPQSMENVLEAAKQSVLIEDFVWIGMESEKDGRNIAKILKGVDVDFFLVRPETYDVPGFREYYSSFNLNKHDPIPSQWFEEFWQHHFQCHLPQSSSPLKQQFPDPCTGTESLSTKPMSQDTFVYHTVSAVTTVAEALHDYLRRYCIHGDAATNLEDCGADARQILWREMRKFMKGPPVTCVDGDCGPLKMSMGYQVFKLKRAKTHQIYEQVGLWKNEQLSLKSENVEFLAGVKTDSSCKRNCRKCLDQLSLDPIEYSLPKPEFYSNFRTLWGVIVSALSLLGVLLVISCAAYFLMSFQVTIGTTVLGYMILFGLLLLYAVNFAFILAPTEGTCGVRRFGLGLAYAVIFAGMLVKVMNIWRMMGYRGNQYFGDTYHITSPAALLVVAVGLVIIQVILSSAWLILIPPTTGVHGGEWRCHPATTFEDELVISLVYVMLMLAITILFSVLTWGCKDNNNESRWIFTCCFLIALVWIAWTVVSTQVLHRYRDLTISAANLVCATVVMLCMYLRKVYLYHKLTRDQESKAKLKQAVPVPPIPNMYGTLTRQTPNITPVTAYNSGARLVGLGGKILERAAPSRMALITSEEENTSESGSGSVQVQATDLYPLDMYDGGSQFQPSSLRLGGSSLVIDESKDTINQKGPKK